MGETTGPIHTLPGTPHDLPDGCTCEQHPDRPAVARIQGETDSFGCELIDMCQECLDADREYERSPEAHTGKCDWCKKDATDLAWARDYDEGMHGPTYEVCAACRRRRDEEDERYLASHDDGYWDYPEDDYDPRDDCGRTADGTCTRAGSEHCDFDCPYSAVPDPQTEGARL